MTSHMIVHRLQFDGTIFPFANAIIYINMSAQKAPHPAFRFAFDSSRRLSYLSRKRTINDLELKLELCALDTEHILRLRNPGLPMDGMIFVPALNPHCPQDLVRSTTFKFRRLVSQLEI